MTLSYALTGLAIVLLILLGRKTLKKAWEQADTVDAVENAEILKSESGLAQTIDLKQYKKNQKRVNALRKGSLQ